MEPVNGFSAGQAVKEMRAVNQPEQPESAQQTEITVDLETSTARRSSPASQSQPVFRETSLAFQVDSEKNEVIIQVVDKHTGEILRQVPPEEIRQLQRIIRLLGENGVDELA